ncbi:ABC transporter permease [Vallitalea okinawensis]|uniref:ABC transporter permease n=1 Tax=Vallitalea okinawensis TaxID=2078660 RepID=UPI000CFD25C9|nr:ABC transporter permease subunit [Vallitalea okinawensis]
MNSFLDLVGYEYKKIFKRKSVTVTLTLSLIVTIFSCAAILFGDYYVDGEPFESHYEGMVKERAYARNLAGREIDTDLLLETAEAYKKVPLQDRYSVTEAYQTYARPYSAIRMIIMSVYNTRLHKFDMSALQNLTIEQADDFYKLRYSKLVESINSMTLNERSKAKILTLDEEVKKPFTFDYIDGYHRFLVIMYTTGMLVCFVSAILLAPIFAGEYTSGTDQLLLASKHGKKKLIYAKLFSGITVTCGICLILTMITYFECMIIYGFDGGDAPFQLSVPMCAYPLTMRQVALLLSISILFANIFSSAITLFLSAKFKSPFGVMIIISIITIMPIFITKPDNNIFLHNLLSLIPSNMMGSWALITPILYELPGISVLPYIFIPIFAIIISLILLPFAYYGFRNHQVG